MYILNRVPSTVLSEKSPFEMLYSKLPSLQHLRVIGCLCFATNLTQKDKFSPRAVRVVLVEYSVYQKGYRLYDLENRTFFVSRDVAFMETVFPFKGSVEDQQTQFMPHQHFYYDDLLMIPVHTTSQTDTVVPPINEFAPLDVAALDDNNNNNVVTPEEGF